jgi:hypothetical protein
MQPGVAPPVPLVLDVVVVELLDPLPAPQPGCGY